MPIVRAWVVWGLIFVLNGCASLHSDSFYVEHARFTDIDLHSQVRFAIANDKRPLLQNEFVLAGHRVISGNNTVLALREFATASGLGGDQGAFQKITILLPSPTLITDEIKLGSESEVIVFWSTGSSSFPGAAGCLGYASSGHLKVVKKSSDSASIEMNFRFDKLLPVGIRSTCEKFQISKIITVGRKRNEELTPWDGAVGRSIYEESIRAVQP